MLKRVLDRYLERFSWVTFFLDVFRIAAIIIIVLGVYNTVTAARYTSAQWVTLIFAGLAQGSIYALIALGYTLVYGILLMINFAHGEVYMAGAFTAVFLANYQANSGFLVRSPFLAILSWLALAALVSTGIALLLENRCFVCFTVHISRDVRHRIPLLSDRPGSARDGERFRIPGADRSIDSDIRGHRPDGYFVLLR
jgi:hypothetical protein